MLMKLWPLIAVSAAAGALACCRCCLVGGFEGDLILLLALLELPSMCIIAAGFSRAPSSARSARRAKPSSALLITWSFFWPSSQ